MKLNQFLYKSIFYIPNKFKNYYNSPDSIYEYKSLLKIMNNKNKKDFSNIVRIRLTYILKSAYKNVPYWQQFDCLKHISKKNVFECMKKLPVLTKQIIRDNSSDMWKTGCTLENSPTGTTGATTGEPLKFLYDSAHELSHQKALYVYMTGIPFNELKNDGKIISFDGNCPEQNELNNNIFWKHIKSELYGSYSFCSFYLKKENIKYYINKLNELKPLIIRGYSNAILLLAKYLDGEKYEINFSLKAIYITSEYCSKENMLYISKIFKCNCFGQYGQSEALHFAWTNPNDNEYFISPFYGYAEVVDENGKHVAEGETGELCVTSLSNKNQPFIRYLTGDRVTYGGRTNGIVKITDLKGRISDFLVGFDKQKYFTVGWLDVHYMKNTSYIKSYQFEQKIIGNVIVRLVISTDENQIKESIENEFKKLFELHNFLCTFEYVDEIPLTKSGKQKIVIQNIQ